jgi:predicted Zn-dependent protease
MARSAAQPAARWRTRADLPLLAAALLACAAWALTPLSDLVVDAIVHAIPLERDSELGAAAVAAARYTLARDEAGVASLGRALVAALPREQRTRFNFTFDVIEAPYVNAFAYPGGAVFITRRLITDLRVSKAELAAVLSHEMGHVIARHSQKAALKANVLLWVVRALLREDGDDEHETFGENVHEMLLEQALSLTRLSFSRRHEFEADALGVRFMRAGGHPAAGMVSFFDKLLSLEAGSAQPVPWFSTHPATRERVRTLREQHGA